MMTETIRCIHHVEETGLCNIGGTKSWCHLLRDIYGAMMVKANSWIPMWYWNECELNQMANSIPRKTHCAHNPKQRGQRTILHTPQLLQLLRRQLLERRVPADDRLERDVRHRPRPRRHHARAVRRDGLRARDRYRARELPLQTGAEVVNDARHDLVRHREAAEPAVLGAHRVVRMHRARVGHCACPGHGVHGVRAGHRAGAR